MTKIKIIFLCHFSNSMVRSKLNLKSQFLRKLILKVRGIPCMIYDDYAIWVSDYIEEFEKHKECEFHIVSPHCGMIKKYQNFKNNGIFYHFWGYKDSIFHSIVNRITNIDRKSNYCINRRRIQDVVNTINPDLVCLCGAENPYYSSGVLDISDKPIYVILQTFLNDPKRIEMGVGDGYRREQELKIFKHATYFSTSDLKAIDFINSNNFNAEILPSGFPSHHPKVVVPQKKNYDFVFFARTVTVFKGIEDVLHALSLLREKRSCSLNIIGCVEESYQKHLSDLCSKLGISDNVFFSGYYQYIQETYNNVVKAKIVVVPGITAALNSTVRESMFMGMPVICYETDATKEINQEKECIITVPMRDIPSLSEKMLASVEDAKKTMEIAMNGKEYAETVFGNEIVVNNFVCNCYKIIDNQNEDFC